MSMPPTSLPIVLCFNSDQGSWAVWIHGEGDRMGEDYHALYRRLANWRAPFLSPASHLQHSNLCVPLKTPDGQEHILMWTGFKAGFDLDEGKRYLEQAARASDRPWLSFDPAHSLGKDQIYREGLGEENQIRWKELQTQAALVHLGQVLPKAALPLTRQSRL